MDVVISLLVAAGVLIGYLTVFVWLTRKVRRGGGGISVGVLGATHEMLAEHRRRAGEMILRRNAGDQIEEDESGDPPDRRARRG